MKNKDIYNKEEILRGAAHPLRMTGGGAKAPTQNDDRVTKYPLRMTGGEYRELSAKEYADLGERILYEDNHLIVFNKKVGEIVQGDKTGDEPLVETLKAFIANRDSKPGKVFLGVPHRLDRPVSGVVIFAKTSKALERLNAMLREGSLHKTYWALVCSKPQPSEALLENWMWRNEKQNKSYVCRGAAGGGSSTLEGSKTKPPRPDAKLARLSYSVIGQTDRYFLVQVQLMTGRHHQIRCQLSAAGFPIKGDLKYGAPRSNPDGGICLHARRLSFIHPVSKNEILVEAPVPKSWAGIKDLSF